MLQTVLAEPASFARRLGCGTARGTTPRHRRSRAREAPVGSVLPAGRCDGRPRPGSKSRPSERSERGSRGSAGAPALAAGEDRYPTGAGHEFPDEAIGVCFDDASTRVARLGEAVEILDGLLRGDAVTFSGDHYRIEGHRAWPPPVQRPRPPILVGGNGRGLVRMAAERADIVGLSGTGRTKADGVTHAATGFPPAAVDERVALLRQASGRRDLELHALVQQVVVTDDPARAAEGVRQRAPELSVADVLGTPYVWIGSVDSICEEILAARERWGFSYFTVFEHSLEAAIPIVARLAGS